MSSPSKWRCVDCGEEYDTKGEADACEAGPTTKPKRKVGDIVFSGPNFGWFDGDPQWVENRERIDASGGPKAVARRKCPEGDTNCFGPCCNYRFFMVVTAIDHPHARWRYHLATGAMKPTTGYHAGWTFDEGHYGMTLVRRVDVPRLVLASAATMVGQKTDRLL